MSAATAPALLGATRRPPVILAGPVDCRLLPAARAVAVRCASPAAYGLGSAGASPTTTAACDATVSTGDGRSLRWSASPPATSTSTAATTAPAGHHVCP